MTTNHGNKTGNILRITCEGSYKTSKLVKRGRYNWVNNDITDALFPIEPHAPVFRTIELVEFDHGLTSKEVLAEFSRRDLERPTYENALVFGIKYPEEQRKRPVVFLHEPVRVAGGHVVLVLGGSARKRRLDLYWFGHWWLRYCVFAAVHK